MIEPKIITVSISESKNLRMEVIHTAVKGVKRSRTVFRPLNPNKPCYRAAYHPAPDAKSKRSKALAGNA